MIDLAAIAAKSLVRAHLALSTLSGTSVTITDTFGTITGTLTVGDYLVRAEFGDEGFTFNVTAPNGDFVASGVWSDDACGVQATRPVIVAA